MFFNKRGFKGGGMKLPGGTKKVPPSQMLSYAPEITVELRKWASIYN